MSFDENCPFCPDNGKVQIIAFNELAYLIAVLTPEGEKMVNSHFVIPRRHYEDPAALPATWWPAMMEMVEKVPGIQAGNYNISLNVGVGAGQRVPHVHFWVIRRLHEAGLPSHNLGLAAVIAALNAGAAT